MEDIWKGATFWSFHWKAPSRTYLVLSISWGLTIPESPEGNASEVIYPSPINGEASEIGEEEKTKRWWMMGGLAIQSGRGYGGRVWLGTNCQWASSRDQILGRKHSPDPHGTHIALGDNLFFTWMNIFFEWIILIFYWMNKFFEWIIFVLFEWINFLNEYFYRIIEWIIEWIKKYVICRKIE